MKDILDESVKTEEDVIIEGDELPRYKLTGSFHHDKMGLLCGGSDIVHEGEPNHVMEPINESARVAKQAFLDKISALPRYGKTCKGMS